jgi:hypothetical protein
MPGQRDSRREETSSVKVANVGVVVVVLVDIVIDGNCDVDGDDLL